MELKSWRAVETEDGVKLSLTITGLDSVAAAKGVRAEVVRLLETHRPKGQKAIEEA